MPVTALALASAYDDNEVAADQQYEGKRLAVTGIVDSIDTVFGFYVSDFERERDVHRQRAMLC
jgi:hypothetical protein